MAQTPVSGPYLNTRSKTTKKSNLAHNDDSNEPPTEITSLFTHAATLPIPADELVTKTSEQQDAVAALCARFMTAQEREITDLNSHGIPRLQRSNHIKFLKQALGAYPDRFQKMDASRPWILYWIISALSALGHNVSLYRERAIETFAPLQHVDGGFGGGHGQLSHAAASYAAVLCLAQVGGLDLVNLRTMWQWLGKLKQKDGSFAMAVGGEIDVRGAYCAMTILSLLNLPLTLPADSPAYVDKTSTFLTGLGEWIGKCQTYEGGIGEAPDNEAHGAYVFCSLACLCIMDAPHISIPRYLDTAALLDWLSSRAMAPEGGYSGRTNKLVDACYSHWIGGCWALVEAALTTPTSNSRLPSLWNREALVRYTLCCSQTKQGGLRDKPGTPQDGYHSWYSLAGLSAAQNTWVYDASHQDETQSLVLDSLAIGRSRRSGSPAKAMPRRLTAAFHWTGRSPTTEERRARAFDLGDQVGLIHPVFVIAAEAVKRTKAQFESVVGFATR